MHRGDVPRPPTGALLTVRLGEQRGVDPAVCLRGSGLDLDGLVDPQRMVRASQELVVIRNLIRALGAEPGLGLEAGSMFRLSSYGIWGFALLSSPTLRSAIDVALQFLDLTFAFCDIEGRTVGQELQLAVAGTRLPTDSERFLVERDIAGVQTIQRDLFVEPLPLARVALTFPTPAEHSLDRYRRMFGVQPQFGARENLIAFPVELLDRPLPQANEVTRAMALGQLRDLLTDRLARTGLAGQVRDILLSRLGDPPSASMVAAQLHVSERTLRERLAEEGTSFRALHDEIRERVAEELLVKGNLPVAEVSERLGYIEVSSFSQAFRRWKGMGPRAWRNSITA
ncbi:MAG: AraC family transcriptional regulator [Nocardia sp.]|nr:AraC family transcriptional regulator [Nocardia sp.]